MMKRQLKQIGFKSYALFTVGLLFVASFFLVAALSNTNASAWYGRTDHKGYFDNNLESGFIPEYGACGNKAPVLPNRCYKADAIPALSNVDQYYNYLHTTYDNGTAYGDGLSATRSLQWSRTGVSFIVNAMLGRTGANAHRNLTNADWTELKSRLDFIATKGRIDFRASMDVTDSEFGGINTFYQYDNNDVSNLTQTAPELQMGIRFIYGGKTVFAVYYRCANPIGNLPGLPDVPQPNFELKPTINSDDKGIANPGQSISYTPVIKNTGTTTSTTAQWQTVTFTTTGTPKGATQGPQTPQQYYGNGATVVNSGSGTYPKGSTQVGAASKTIPASLPVGTKVCYALAVKPYNQSTTDWRYSDPVCFFVGKYPNTQVIGGDLRVGNAFSGSASNSRIETSVTTRSGIRYGSWGEYALVAPGAIKNTGSGSAYSGGLACASGCKTNILSFTNESSTIGNYKSTTTLPNVAATFPVSSATPKYTTVNQTILNSKQVVTADGNITVSGGTVNKGNWLVINAPARTVTITGDIKYTTDALSSASDIPQVVIIANQINIAGGVKNVDAWLVASGTTGYVNTCSDVATTAKLTSAICSNALTINGPVMAKKLFLRRTAGAEGANPSTSAETINLRPDAYLWGSYQASQSPRLETTSTIELPPRF